jgi:hypothetical protein
MAQFSASSALTMFDIVRQSRDPIGEEIARFLDGTSDGALLLHALYDTIADEPIPERLLAVIGKCDKQEDTPLPASVSVSTR